MRERGESAGVDFIVCLWQGKIIQEGVGIEKETGKHPKGRESNDYGKW